MKKEFDNTRFLKTHIQIKLLWKVPATKRV